MELTVHIKDPIIWYNEELKVWRLHTNIRCGADVSSSVMFTSKRKNKVKKNFYKWAIQGILGDEIEYLFKENKIHFKEE